jgi:hypothetical protein
MILNKVSSSLVRVMTTAAWLSGPLQVREWPRSESLPLTLEVFKGLANLDIKRNTNCG